MIEAVTLWNEPNDKSHWDFTPESCGTAPHHTSAPREPEQFPEFCARMLRRYA